MSILEQVLALGAQLTPEERQQVIDTWRDPNDAPDDLEEATKRMLDAELARMARGEGQSHTLDEAMTILHSRRQS